jgi:tRNA A37 threonylcarbamoyladenosine dehydratase
MIKEQYIKNIDNDTFPEEVQNILSSKNIAIIGCGGQGGYIIDFLARLGVNSISFWDGDNYETTNLNR